jgi:recombination protein RecA
MALPAHLLELLPPGVRAGTALGEERVAALPLDELGVDAVLPDGGLPRGTVVELAVSGGAAFGTRLALLACRAAQRSGEQPGLGIPWCAYLDPTGSLYAPGVARAEVSLERLLVVRPRFEDLSRTAIRMAEARAFAVLVVDTTPSPIDVARVTLGSWVRVVRRLALAVEGTEALVLLITESAAPRSVPLPVALRLELRRDAEAQLSIRVAKDRHGRVSAPRSLVWARGAGGI